MARSITTPRHELLDFFNRLNTITDLAAYLPIPLLLYQPTQQQPNGGIIVGDQDLSSHWVGTSNRSVFPIEQGTFEETLPRSPRTCRPFVIEAGRSVSRPNIVPFC